MKKRIRNIFGITALCFALALFGCTHTMSTDVAELQGQLKQKNMEIDELASANRQKDKVIEEYRGKIDAQSKVISEMESMPTLAEGTPEATLLPPQARSGECYARVFVPPTYRTITEKVLKHGASERIEIIPAQYEWVEEKILVKEASERIEVIPAQYDWVEEKVLVKAASARMEEVPAEFEWVSDKMLVKPAHTVWKRGRGLIEKVDHTTGEIMCLVEVPASYKTVKKKVMVKPPTARKVEIPAEYKTVKKRVMVKAPTERKILIPAEYKTVKVRKMTSGPQERLIPIPAEYQTVTRTEQIADGKMEWRRVLCETNTTPKVIASVQSALAKAGHAPGPIDGILGSQTLAAIKSYQKEKNFAMGGLTYVTLESLGVTSGQ